MTKFLRTLVLCAAIYGGATFAGAGAARAGVAPDDFRDRVLDASAHCYAAYRYLSMGDGDLDLRQAAEGQAQGALELYNSYAYLMSETDKADYLWQASMYLTTEGFTYDQYFDMAVYCDDALNDLIDEATSYGYYP